MATLRQIIAIGGEMFLAPHQKLLRYVLKQSGKRRPRVCYFPHASDNLDWSRASLAAAVEGLACETSILSLFATPPAADLADMVLSQDVILVGGGNTKSMLALWRDWGIDALLRRAYRAGTVLAGVSAGGNCWFNACVTDSISVELAGLSNGLGFLRGSFCPHYDGETMRRPTFHRLVATGALPAGIACDDSAAAHFVDGKLQRIVAAKPNARGYRVAARRGVAVETMLPVRVL
jgi:dipeptidase E